MTDTATMECPPARGPRPAAPHGLPRLLGPGGTDLATHLRQHGPLPWRGMPPFPFAHEVARPEDPAYASYLRAYHTRPAGGASHR